MISRKKYTCRRLGQAREFGTLKKFVLVKYKDPSWEQVSKFGTKANYNYSEPLEIRGGVGHYGQLKFKFLVQDFDFDSSFGLGLGLDWDFRLILVNIRLYLHIFYNSLVVNLNSNIITL